MEISKEKLAVLETWQFAEYQEIERRENSLRSKGSVAFLVFCGFVYFPSCIFLIVSLVKASPKSWEGWVPCIGVIVGYLALAFIEPLAEYALRFFDYVFERRKNHKRCQELKSQFITIEKEIEAEAISILLEVEKSVRDRRRENSRILYDLRLKRKWQSWYENDLKKVKKNCELNSLAVEIVDKNIKHIKYDLERQKHFQQFQKQLNNPFSAYQTLTWKLSSLYGRPESVKLDTPDSVRSLGHAYSPPVSSDRRPSSSVQVPRKYDASKPLGLDPGVTKPSPSVDHATTRKPTSTLDRAKREETVTNKPKSHKQEVKTGGLSLENNTPIKDGTPESDDKKSYRIIKASPEYYQKVASRNMLIGMKGELCVLEYEGRRVWKEEGTAYLTKLEHVSVTQGDGLGYDIASIENNKKIFIEVKTTTGQADAPLFFTGREFVAMDEFADRYYLYRIYEFDEVAGKGKLNIFKGKNEILEHYKYRPKDWILSKR